MTEQEEGHLKIYDKITGKGYTNYKLGYIPYAIMMYDEDSQAGEHSCEYEWEYHNKCIYIYATLVTSKLNINYIQMLIPGNSEISTIIFRIPQTNIIL